MSFVASTRRCLSRDVAADTIRLTQRLYVVRVHRQKYAVVTEQKEKWSGMESETVVFLSRQNQTRPD
jgi:hypothetical protein